MDKVTHSALRKKFQEWKWAWWFLRSVNFFFTLGTFFQKKFTSKLHATGCACGGCHAPKARTHPRLMMLVFPCHAPRCTLVVQCYWKTSGIMGCHIFQVFTYCSRVLRKQQEQARPQGWGSGEAGVGARPARALGGKERLQGQVVRAEPWLSAEKSL